MILGLGPHPLIGGLVSRALYQIYIYICMYIYILVDLTQCPWWLGGLGGPDLHDSLRFT